jgi:rhodanese-related sulfurtransferase
MRGEGPNAHKEFFESHIIGSVSFPHGWLNRDNYFSSLARFKNLEDKIIIVFMDNERHGTNVAKVLTEKGFGNIYLLTGGLQVFAHEYPSLIKSAEK